MDVSDQLRAEVISRAARRCEYCLIFHTRIPELRRVSAEQRTRRIHHPVRKLHN